MDALVLANQIYSEQFKFLFFFCFFFVSLNDE